MHACKISVFTIAALLLSLPLAAAAVEEGQRSDMTSITKMKIFVYTDYSGEDASGVREDIDDWNNSDGVVSTSEVNDYKAILDSLLTEPLCSYYLDDSRGNYENIEYIIQNAEGSTQSTEDLTIATEWIVIFPSSNSNTHEIKNDNTFKDPGTRYVITCPEGYRWTQSNGLEDVTITEDSRTIEATLTDRPITLTLTNTEPKEESPSLTTLAAITTILTTAAIFKKTQYN